MEWPLDKSQETSTGSSPNIFSQLWGGYWESQVIDMAGSFFISKMSMFFHEKYS